MSVAVTGSNGKSTTVDLLGRLGIAAVAVPVGATVPAPVSAGVVLNAGTAHLARFGSRSAIAEALGRFVAALAPDAVTVLNADDPAVTALGAARPAEGRLLRFGEAADADVRAVDVDTDELGRASFSLQAGPSTAPVHLRLAGTHLMSDALAAAAVALQRGRSVDEVAAALSRADPRLAGRMALVERSDGTLVVDDSRAADPESVRAALKTLAAVGRRRSGAGRTFAVVGELTGLGPAARSEHDGLGRLAVRLDLARLIAVGEGARAVQHGAALEGSWNGEAGWVPDADAAIDVLLAEVRPGDAVLVTGSPAASLERVARAVAEDGAQGLGRRTEGDGS